MGRNSVWEIGEKFFGCSCKLLSLLTPYKQGGSTPVFLLGFTDIPERKIIENKEEDLSGFTGVTATYTVRFSWIERPW